MVEIDQKIERRVVRTKFHRLEWWVLLAIILLTAFIRYGLLDVPLERDEGEYGYGGQLILQCMPLYQHLYSMKLPGIYAAYAVILALFGQSHTAIHLGLLLINIATIVVIFLLAKRLINSLAAIIAAASFAVLSIGQSVQGVFANAEHFAVLPAISGALLLLKAMDEDIPQLMFYSGLLFGLAFLMKQHGALFIAFGGLYLLIDLLFNHKADDRQSKIHGFLLFSVGAIAPYGLICLIFFLSGGFEKFWFLTFEYAKTYSSQIPLRMAWVSFKSSALPIGRSVFMIWILAGIGTTALFLNRRIRRRSIFIAMFTIFSFLSICLGFYFRPHYFIMVLPAAALLSGIGVSTIANMLSFIRLRVVQYGAPILIAVVCLAISVYQQRNFLFQMTPFQASRSTYGLNPFPESLEISKFIKSHSKKDEQIAVIGSEPQIYFYSGRLSATGYIYMYPLMEKHPFALQMQKEMIREIESAKPKFLVFTNVTTSWLKRPDSNPLLFEWFNGYQAKHYSVVGFADLLKDKTIYCWEPTIKEKPGSPLRIVVFERKN
ncbi:MAG: hypothetical protein AUJ48_03975 [Deltaproteobacteria bacterium CG1_02_45_11]|nr:MAG: hypothetical protein AUJ48_03975 [Deltaproteobacteria bacterium CG1_02_45_11]